MTESECSLLSPEYCIIEEGAGRDGRVGASVGLTGRVGAARGLGIFLHGDRLPASLTRTGRLVIFVINRRRWYGNVGMNNHKLKPYKYKQDIL